MLRNLKESIDVFLTNNFRITSETPTTHTQIILYHSIFFERPLCVKL